MGATGLPPSVEHDGRPLGRWDAWQRRHPVVALPLAVVYKFFDDQGAYLAVLITYYAFVSVVPLLLLATSILGFLLQGDAELRAQVLDSAVASFPVVGDQLGRPEGLQGSVTAIVVGGLTALYGSLGLGTALQNAVNTTWSVPRNSRPNPFLVRVRSLVLLATGGLALVALSVLAALNRVLAARLGGSAALQWGLTVALVGVVAGILAVMLWVGGGRRQRLRTAVPGAVLTAVLWQVLQVVSASVASEAGSQASSMNQTFGLVLGLLAVTYVAATSAVLGMELNVVLRRRLWPRALLTPFTDAVDLTDADRRAYAAYARAQRHKGFETVEVSFQEDRED
ncbi:YihY/virulence factor BrkB family protein [Nocardioides sp. Arc9.136]|uniref:YihY/virulence factor BrkB family protein n=1 Tax=Nocardioides sp. Arc9.136 TaxID=2996826 RepID=UPI0026661BD8|nr:YihY/virulence factor BrkB family protein [Nocardioides sp. Arc9.136]WKN48896.1 YihY/virulence factor BrkB family protein [Nocardioides sp. Arc9.136]